MCGASAQTPTEPRLEPGGAGAVPAGELAQGPPSGMARPPAPRGACGAVRGSAAQRAGAQDRLRCPQCSVVLRTKRLLRIETSQLFFQSPRPEKQEWGGSSSLGGLPPTWSSLSLAL